MADFTSVRAYLEREHARLAHLAELDGGDTYEREVGNLKRLWDSGETDQDYLLQETLTVLQKYPPVVNDLRSNGLLGNGAVPPLTAAAVKTQDSASLPTTPAPPAASAPPAGRPAPSAPAAPPAPSAPPAAVPAQQAAPPSAPPAAVPAQQAAPPSARSQPGSPPMATPPTTQDRIALIDKRIAAGKELITGLMGVLIVLATLYVAINSFATTNAEARAASKDVLLFLNGLVGVVLGYYFGRVPGEVRADRAEAESAAAKSDLEQAINAVEDTLNSATPTSAETSRGSLGSDAPPGSVQLNPAQIEALRKVVRRYRP